MTTRNRGGPQVLGAVGSITDVAGIRVGHHQRVGRGWQTGTTVVLAPGGATPGVDVRGGGPGTRETDALRAENLVTRIHAICLTGGSAYGLASAEGVVSWLEQRGLGFAVGPIGATGSSHVVPVVPAAVIFDLGRGGEFAHRPDHAFGVRAARNARSAQHRWGAVGAGTGARAGGLQGGVGTAGTVVRIPHPVSASASAPMSPVDVVVGALAVVNANGSIVDPADGMPWEPAGLLDRAPTSKELRRLRQLLDERAAHLNTTIGVVATSARLTKSEASKMASVAHDGLARAIRPAHSMFDGDTIFSLATGEHHLPDGTAAGDARAHNDAFNHILAAAADTFATACTHAVLSASTTGSLPRALPGYFDLCPSTRPP